MIGIIEKLTGRNGRPDHPQRLPAELVKAIGRLEVLRRHHDPEEGDRVAIRITGLGSLYLGEGSDLPERIMAAYPELTPTCARRAVRLIEAELAERNRRVFQGKAENRKSWVWSWAD